MKKEYVKILSSEYPVYEKFALLDVTNDGIPELLVSQYNYLYVYWYNSSMKRKCLYSGSVTSVKYDKKNNDLFVCYSGNDYTSIDDPHSDFIDKKTVKTFSYCNFDKSGKYTKDLFVKKSHYVYSFGYDPTTVYAESKSAYEKVEKAYSKADTVTLAKNTSAARAKLKK